MYKTDILKHIEMSENIYIAGHINPDGDAISSCYAFAMAMKKLNKNPKILLEEIPQKYDFLPGKQFWYTGDYSLLEPGVFFALDCGDKQRLGNAAQVFDNAVLTYNIDHHGSNTNFAQVNVVNGTASSASEMVFEILTELNIDIDYDMAVALYSGIVFDTGGFKHNSTLKRTHEIAGLLVEKGVPTADIHSKILYEHTLPQIKVFNKALMNMGIEGKIAYSTLTLEEIKSCDAQISDLDGITEYLLNTVGVEISVLVTQRGENTVKISFRSRQIPISDTAIALGGGGHKLAAGAGCEGTVEEVLKTVLKMLKSVVENG